MKYSFMLSSARVFISCGQRSDELRIAEDIADLVNSMNFEPYIARTQQTLNGLVDNIFSKLEESEYFIFIDFKREKLCKFENDEYVPDRYHRGSLFSHQELALATYLKDIEVIAFQEEGVKPEEGILRYIQANCYNFSNRNELPELIREKIIKKGWQSDWRNELTIDRETEYAETILNTGETARFFHIRVRNNHKSKIALNCSGYIEKIVNIDTDEEIKPELVELKWKGVTTSSVNSPPKNFRLLDAFHIRYTTPQNIELGLNPFIVDSGSYVSEYTLDGSSNFILHFVIFSFNFPSKQARFILRAVNNVEEVSFERLS